ncbi:MAG: cytochrome P460 family protein [Planctomycetes bacterium]|nr:cytochrome P460 family protein [Planctomycetota bacterium]
MRTTEHARGRCCTNFPKLQVRRPTSLVLLCAVLAACRSGERDPSPAPATSDDALVEQVQRIARDYPTWGELNTALRVAPMDCRRPRATSRGSLTISFADSGPHSTKLYRLYARDPAAYRGVESGASQAGQVLVKETFVAEPFRMSGPGEAPADVVETPEGMFRAGAPAGLFVMQRDASAESSERAWTYATVAPSGEVTALGRIDSCIRCHLKAPYGGLFGLER